MTIEKIKIGYSTSIPIAAYGIKDNAWAEIEVNTNGEPYNYDELFSKLKETVDNTVKAKYPHLYNGEISIVADNKPVPIIPLEISEANVQFTLEQEIENCDDLVNLQSCEFLIKTTKDKERQRNLYLLFDKKKKELQKISA
jgi:hypothetical protein